MSVDIIYVDKRPDFGPDQIRTPEELYVGLKLVQFSKVFGYWALLEVKKLIDQDGDGPYITTIEIDSEGCVKCKKIIYLKQHSILPNEEGKWSNSWCLKKTEIENVKDLFEENEKLLEKQIS